jgi:hypothetical protein
MRSPPSLAALDAAITRGCSARSIRGGRGTDSAGSVRFTITTEAPNATLCRADSPERAA